ncbi:oxidoreductase-like domain-containing protein [Dokdonella sp.]|uniref:oxidoreductase-like domain-containing protein n=1 Tax=Dokdonella sp. TaxID=2291710 RepID=UPI003C4DF349
MDSTISAVITHEDPRPQKPAEPDPLDCCGSGCTRCVFDIHDEAVQRYKDALAAWRASRSKKESGDA